MKFRIAAAWEGGKVYDFLLGFHTVNFALSSDTASTRPRNAGDLLWVSLKPGLVLYGLY